MNKSEAKKKEKGKLTEDMPAPSEKVTLDKRSEYDIGFTAGGALNEDKNLKFADLAQPQQMLDQQYQHRIGFINSIAQHK